jgi:uncharacterized protein
MFMYYDWTYVLYVMLPTLVISGAASMLVHSRFNRYSKVMSRTGFTGAEAAYALLQRAGIHDVEIVPAHGFLSDHYNPASKQLALSPDVFNGRSLASIGVAAHETGHAIQHATNYSMLHMRTALVPVAMIGSQLSWGVIFLGLIMNWPGAILTGAILFGGVLLFQVVTLPVEFDATARAKRLVVEAGILDPDERYGVDKVLNAAALTYVAAVITSLLTLLYYLWRAGVFGRSDD